MKEAWRGESAVGGPRPRGPGWCVLVTFDHQWLELDGQRVHFVTSGQDGSPVILLHGGGLDRASLTYRYAIGPLSDEHRVFAPDLPGYGESDPLPEPANFGRYALFLDRFMRQMGLEQASLVGTSIGGAIALAFCLRWPERVPRLVLVDSYGLGGELRHLSLPYLALHLPLLGEAAGAALRASPWAVRKGLEYIVYDRRMITPDLIAEIMYLAGKPGAGRAWRSLQRPELTWHGLRTNYMSRLAAVTAPTLIVHGAEDRVIPVAWAKRAHRLLPHAELRILPACGHWPPRERPDEFNRLVANFLRPGR